METMERKCAVILALNMSKNKTTKSNVRPVPVCDRINKRDIYDTMKFSETEMDKIDVVFEKFHEYCEPRKTQLWNDSSLLLGCN